MSVSISASISPSPTTSPTFFNHAATVPSVIVSLKRGILITSTPSGTVMELFEESELAVLSSLVSSRTSAVVSALLPFIISEMSSPSSPMIASKTSTGELPPSGIPICNKVPS